METRDVVKKCPNCEEEGEKKPKYFWRKVDIYRYETAKAIEGVEIYCGLCHRTITVLPSELLSAVED